MVMGHSSCSITTPKHHPRPEIKPRAGEGGAGGDTVTAAAVWRAPPRRNLDTGFSSRSGEQRNHHRAN